MSHSYPQGTASRATEPNTQFMKTMAVLAGVEEPQACKKTNNRPEKKSPLPTQEAEAEPMRWIPASRTSTTTFSSTGLVAESWKRDPRFELGWPVVPCHPTSLSAGCGPSMDWPPDLLVPVATTVSCM